MSDEYQLRRDIDRIWKSIYNLDDNSLRVVTIGESVQKIRELKSLDKIFEYYQLLDIGEKMPDKVNRSEIYDLLYPIGSVYLTTQSSFNPNNTFNGTWQILNNSQITGVIMWERINETE